MVIGFDQTMYMVGGDDGQVVLTVSVQEGDLSGDAVVRLTTRDGTAVCKSLDFVNSMLIQLIFLHSSC